MSSSPVIDEALEGSQMEITDSEDSPMTSHGASNLLNELNANDRTVHSDFQNKFEIDLFNDKDLQ